ncbi:MAG: hypothetical protein U1U88_001781 [Lawsonella clevelandensis]
MRVCAAPPLPFRHRSATAGLLASLLLCATAVAFPADAQAALAPADSLAPTATLPVGSPEPGQAALPAQPAPAGLCAVTMRKALTSTLQTSGITSFGGIGLQQHRAVAERRQPPPRPASVTKLLAASAALHALSPTGVKGPASTSPLMAAWWYVELATSPSPGAPPAQPSTATPPASPT